MNEYMPDQGYGQGMADIAGSAVRSRIRYMNIILTILLAVVFIAGAVLAVMTARISRESEKTGQAVADLSSDISSIADEVYYISDEVDDILRQRGGNPSSTFPTPDVYVEPDWGEYTDKPVVYLYPDKDAVDTHVELVMSERVRGNILTEGDGFMEVGLADAAHHEVMGTLAFHVMAEHTVFVGEKHGDGFVSLACLVNTNGSEGFALAECFVCYISFHGGGLCHDGG